jgi:epoxide hydrolase-like predicted phosphatase
MLPTKAIIFDFFGVLFVDRQLNQPLIDLIRNLNSDYKIGMLSNMDRSWLEAFSHRAVVEELFDCIVLSGDEGIIKPDPRIYKIVAKKLKVEPEQCVMVDDLIENIDAANELGMRGIWYKDMSSLDQLVQ